MDKFRKKLVDFWKGSTNSMPLRFLTYMFELLHIKSWRSRECNQCGALYVIATQVAYVIKPNHTPTVMTYTLSCDYIPLKRITYQAFGLDKNKTVRRLSYFLAGE